MGTRRAESKACELVDYTLVELAQMILDAEDEVADLGSYVAELAKERDELAAKLDAA